MKPLGRSFYDRDPASVAKDLLGCLILRRLDSTILCGRIVETEAYLHGIDPGSHSYRKRTKKNASMFGPPGHAYVYAIHSRWCFNVVTEPVDIGSAVLIRAMEPLVGLDVMRRFRHKETILDLASGPAKLCEAMAIDRSLDGHDLTKGRPLTILPADAALPEKRCLKTTLANTSSSQPNPSPLTIGCSPRIGLSQGRDLLLRFFYTGSRFVSRHRRSVHTHESGG